MVPLHAESAEKVVFGPFALNIKTAELFSNGKKIRLSGQAAQLVVILVQRPGQLVTREELRTALWPEDTFVDFGHGLNNCISRVREAMGDSAVTPRYIQTLPKQGYRFIGEVCVIGEAQRSRSETVADLPPPLLPAEAAPMEPAWEAEPIPERRWKWIAWLTLVVIAGVAISIALLRRPRHRIATAEIASVAVLPIVNLSGDPTQEYRPNAQVAAANHSPPLVRPEAYEEYLKGEYFWDNLDLPSALRHFERAISVEPQYSAAYGGLAKTYCRMEYSELLPPAEAFLKASDAIEKAFLLDPRNAEAHAAHSFVLAQWHWNWPEAESELQRAIAADPNNYIFHSWYSYILTRKGRTRDALQQAELAYHSGPASPFTIAGYAEALRQANLLPESVEQYRAALEFSPLDPGLHFRLANVLRKSEKPDQAAAELEQAYHLQKEGDIAVEFARRYRSDGYTSAADAAQLSHLRRALRVLEQRRLKHQYVSPSEYVDTYAGMRNSTMTLRWLERAYREHSQVMVELRDERFDFLRRDPRFAKLYQQVPFEQ